MYIAMNRFRISKGHEGDFISIWKNRNSLLDKVDGFKEFKLLQGETDAEGTTFVSHSIWKSKKAFDSWNNSEHFRKAHAGAKAPQGTYLGHPKFEGFEVILNEERQGASV